MNATKHDINNVYFMYMKCKAQAEYHYKEHLKFLSYAKYYQQMRQNVAQPQVNAYNADNSQCSSSNSRETKKKRRKRWTERHSRNYNNEQFNNYNEEYNDQNKEEVVEELEVDPAFKEFLKKSEEFRRARDAEKLKSGSKKDGTGGNDDDDTYVEYVDVTRKAPSGSTLPPKSVNRKELYEERYGDRGMTILRLETAMQWKFDKFNDSKTPKPWPAMPFKF